MTGATLPELVVVGLGPGDSGQLTVEASRWLDGRWPVLLRTRRHPTVDGLPGAAGWTSFDELYDRADDFAALYTAIVERLQAELATANGPLVYAVPGHPLFAESTVKAVIDAGLPVRVVPGVSLVDAAAAALRRDPVAEGWQLVDALELVAIAGEDPFAGGRLPYRSARAALVCQVYNRRVASATKLALMRLLPDDHPVTLVQAAGVSGAERTVQLPLYQIDRDERLVDHLTSLYVPAGEPLTVARGAESLAAVAARLRAPGGCPWDREQTHRSLIPHVVEEAYEVVEAIESGDGQALCEELGDLLLQVVLHAQLAEEEGAFLLEDVFEAITTKLVRRHPHVFGDVAVGGSADVLRNWDRIKAAERQAKGHQETLEESVFAGIPRSLPALARAAAVLRRGERTGRPGGEAGEAVARLMAVAASLAAANDADARRRAVGQLLWQATVLARRLEVEPEEALRLATDEYRRLVESSAGQRVLQSPADA